MKEPKNPFILTHRIERPYFCDRFEDQQRLTSAVLNGRNVVLISPRRMGKTSLVYVSFSTPEEIRNEYQVFFIDILQTNTLEEFTYLLGKSIFETLRSKSAARVRSFLSALKSLKGSFGYDPVSGAPTFDIMLGDIKNPEYTLEEIFGYMERSAKPVILVIDEFQQITKYPGNNAEAILRSHIQKLSNATFVFAGSERSILQEMFASSKRPFYNSSEIMHLGPIPEETYVDFATGLFGQRGRSIDPEAVSWAFRLFEGNTFYVQRTMNGAFALTSENERCTAEDVRKSVRGMLEASEIVYREMLSNISVSQKMTLCAIARHRVVKSPMSGAFVKGNGLPSASSVQSALLKLSKDGLISRDEDGYRVIDPLFRLFINELYSVSEI